MRKILVLSFVLVLSLQSVVYAQFLGFGKKRSKKKDDIVKIHTSYGDMVVVLFDTTPKHKENFLKLANEHFYDSTTFHRVLNDFMIQGGDPYSKPDSERKNRVGTGGPGYQVDAEFDSNLKHDVGMLAAARQGDFVNPEKKSSGSQFYIVEAEEGAHHLDGEYSIFGKVIKGLDVVHKIAEQPVNRQGLPHKDIYMTMEVERMKKKKITELYKYEYPDKK